MQNVQPVHFCSIAQDAGIPKGKCLTHLENMGRPHCCTILKTDEGVTVWDFDCIMAVSSASFEAAVRDGMDSSTCVFFTLDGGKDEDFEAACEHLLDLAAGGEPEEVSILIDETEEEILSPRVGKKEKLGEQELQWLDPDGQVTVEHALLKELEVEIAKYQDQANRGKLRGHKGTFRCPACPFRTWLLRTLKNTALLGNSFAVPEQSSCV